ncbi:MAG: membrane protein insertase YidC [Akkermansiaceae bacterium]|jgi:YidC/Oxa1 family membrane protein insertase|nr:membrane protein insertase YidC [Akkermansiaceae bacterium]MDG1853458.1 membrane protein insertase YidC [Verrucomicrobiales bacterium]
MDRTGWIVIIACSLGLFLWFDGQKKSIEEQRELAEKNQQSSQVVNPDGAGEVKEKKEVQNDPVIESTKEQFVTLSNGVADWTFTNVGGGIKTVALKEHNLESPEVVEKEGLKNASSVILNKDSKHPIGALSKGIGKFEGLNYEVVSQSPNQIEFRAESSEKLQVTKTFTLTGNKDPGEGHIIKMDLALKYLGEGGNFSLNDYFLYAGSASQLQDGNSRDLYTGFEYMRGSKDKFRSLSYLKKDKDDIKGQELHEKLRWIGVSNQFFSTNLYVKNSYESSVWASRFEVNSDQYASQGALGLPKNITLNPGESKAWEYEIYTGPKSYQILKGLDGERKEIVGFDRMPIFGFFAEPFAVLLSWLMNLLHSGLGNFGWAIISITVIMRLSIWPITAKGTRAMKKMSKLAPMMQEIKEKHSDNPQKMQQETMKLYKDYGVNPIGGCLPLLLQMPIFIGYFAMLRSAVELRHEGWIGWVNDLSLPDSVGEVPGLGIPINILPLLMGITMMFQMRMTPQAAGPNQKQMQLIMSIMPIFITVICYNFASALALYWTAGNIFSIGQTWISKKFGKEVELKKVDRSMKKPPIGAPGGQTKSPKPQQVRTGGGGRRKRR